jgi:hypothetical protein
MNELSRALVDIRSIRRQVAQTTVFRGYGPLTLSATAVLAVAAGIAQSVWIAEPATHPTQYVALWLATGLLSAALIAAQMLTRANRLHSGMADEMIRMAVAQFLPAAVAGAILPFVVLHTNQSAAWMLPGLWQIIFSLGVFASCRCLPRPMLLAGAWFMLTGLACITLGDARALAPFAMSSAFGVGMAMVATIHFVFAKEVSTDDEEAI